MKNSTLIGILTSSLALAVGALITAPPVWAQQDDEQTEAVEEDALDRVVVTGSRLRRDEYTSISPLQVVDAGEARLFGLVDAGAIIADSPVVSGEQLDGSVTAGSPTAAVEGISSTGLGGQAVALRGLGPERTLLMVNGRRLSPSGVRGAPVAPDLNLVPGSIIDRVEILTDGASSIYGADAVAGVANIILRSDVDGLELTGFATAPQRSGGEITQLGLLGGASNDRGNFTMALEYFNRESVIVGDRSNFNDCLRSHQIGTDGNVYSACRDNRPANSAFVLSAGGVVFLAPGFQSEGLPPDWIRNAEFLAQGVNFRTTDLYTLQDSEREANLLEELERFNIFVTGHQDIDLFSRDSFYFEASYASRNSEGVFPREQVFPGIPGFIPQEDANGNIIVDEDGAPILVQNPLNPFGEDALPVLRIQDLDQRRASEVSNLRAVAGLEGELDLGALGQRNWVYDVWASYDRSFGTSKQRIMIDPHLRESLYTLRMDADGNLICGIDDGGTLNFGFPNAPDCVVVDFFAPSLFTAAGGDGTFATQEEADWLFGNSITQTRLEQTMFSGIVTGDLFDLRSGTVGLVLGAEYRKQRIASETDIVRGQGLASSEVPDLEGDTIGSTSLWELFAETELPLHDMFTLNLSGRYTSEENFGSEFTYSVKADFAPIEFLRIRSTYGTTFRAPNLREQFLAGQAGTISGLLDPCRVPNDARDADGNYDPTLDNRTAELLANCQADGVDPTQLGLLATTGIPTTTGGNPDAQAETSDSFTFGVVFSQPWSDRYDWQLSATYFDIEINDTLRESNPAAILAQCYGGEPGLANPNCDRISRAGGNPATAVITNVDAAFINIGKLTSRGVDFNTRFRTDLGGFLGGAELTVTAMLTRLLEQKEQVNPEAPVRDFAGTIGTPKWRGNLSAAVDSGPWTGVWRMRYIGDAQQLDTPAFAAPSPANACGILGAPEGVMCRDIDFVGSYFQHDVSLSYNRDDWGVTLGVANVFDRAPPIIGQGRGPARMNIVVQSGYDLIGRRAFLNLTKRY